MAILALAFDGRLYEHHIRAIKKYSKIKKHFIIWAQVPPYGLNPQYGPWIAFRLPPTPPCFGYKKYSNYNYMAVTAVLESESPIHYRGHYFHNFGGGLLETRTMHLFYLKYIKDQRRFSKIEYNFTTSMWPYWPHLMV